MSSFALAGTGIALVLWFVATVYLVKHPRPGSDTDAPLSLRLLVLLMCLGAGVGGCWGPTVHTSTEMDLVDGSLGSPGATVVQGFRTPVVAAIRSVDLTLDGERIRETRVRSYHLPLSLLAVVVWSGWWAIRRNRLRPAGRLLTWGALLLIAPGCGSDAEVLERAERRVLEVGWDTLAVIESLPEDTVFFDIRRVAADRHGIRVLDGAGSRVALVDWTGEVQWYSGRRGAGPGEFENPRAVAVDGDGTTWVLDVQTHRITGFDRTGAFSHEVPLLELDFVPHEFAVDPAGERFFMARPDEGIQPVEVARDGSARTGARYRFPGSRDAPPLALQGDVRAGADGDGWVVALNMGDGLLRFDGVEPLGGFVPYVEHVPLARVDVTVEGSPGSGTFSRTQQMVDPIFASRSSAVMGSRILVRFGGRTDQRERLLDIYELGDGAYRGSLLLPTAGGLAAWDGRIVLARNTPHPTLLVLRPDAWP